MPSIKAYLDHVVVLIPYDTLINPPAWITDNFTLSPGGRHADNRTENKLVFFQDGTYLEFIAFINDDAEKRKGHWWDREYGVVDFALTTKPDEPLDHEALKKRMADSGTGITYGEPQAGGRATDGKEIKWQVTFPEGTERGTVPFWCEDVTPREWRVPLTKENTTHPCGALGMGRLDIFTKKDRRQRVAKAARAVVGSDYSPLGLNLRAPNEVDDLRDPYIAIYEHRQVEGSDLEIKLILQCLEYKKGIGEQIGPGKSWMLLERVIVW
ncbi:glyoxalase-like domain-containing protein [Xylariaceae sp. FL1019]|nr:glyoxalase-like domain-containing protein [Xylariaceae sp. FL1019]